MSGVGGRRAAVVVEFRPTSGGADASAFAETLASAVAAFCRRRGEVVDVDLAANPVQVTVPSPSAGLRPVLEQFAGPHRVQRVPASESSGRRQSSVVTVAVLDSAGDPAGEVALDPADVVEEVYRASGPGGQHRNKVSSAVRLRHVPSGVVVCATESRSQWANRTAAWAELERRLSESHRDAVVSARNEDRRLQIDGSVAKGWTWCAYRDEVVHHASGSRMRFRDAVRGRIHV